MNDTKKDSHETWNIKLWLGNDYNLYIAVTEYALQASKPNYKDFVRFFGYEETQTPDGVDWISDQLDYDELDSYVQDFAN